MLPLPLPLPSSTLRPSPRQVHLDFASPLLKQHPASGRRARSGVCQRGEGVGQCRRRACPPSFAHLVVAHGLVTSLAGHLRHTQRERERGGVRAARPRRSERSVARRRFLRLTMSFLIRTFFPQVPHSYHTTGGGGSTGAASACASIPSGSPNRFFSSPSAPPMVRSPPLGLDVRPALASLLAVPLSPLRRPGGYISLPSEKTARNSRCISGEGAVVYIFSESDLWRMKSLQQLRILLH